MKRINLSRSEKAIESALAKTRIMTATSDLSFAIPEVRFDNPKYIEQRVSIAPPEVRGSIRTALKYLYLASGPLNLPLNRKKLAEPFVEVRERVLLRWLSTRTNGRLRSSYGQKALLAARQSRYRCCECGFSDVRALHIDHIDGRTKETQCACLCANCHNIKSRDKGDWSGKRQYRPENALTMRFRRRAP